MSADFRYLWKLLVSEFGVEDAANADTLLEEKIRLRRERVRAFMASLSDWEQVEAAMDKMNLAWGRVRNARTMTEQPTVRARGAIVEIDDRDGGTRPITQSPYRFSGARSGVRGPAPHRGEHNESVLSEWLSMARQDVDALIEAGVLQRDDETLG